MCSGWNLFCRAQLKESLPCNFPLPLTTSLFLYLSLPPCTSLHLFLPPSTSIPLSLPLLPSTFMSLYLPVLPSIPWPPSTFFLTCRCCSYETWTDESDQKGFVYEDGSKTEWNSQLFFFFFYSVFQWEVIKSVWIDRTSFINNALLIFFMSSNKGSHFELICLHH